MAILIYTNQRQSSATASSLTRPTSRYLEPNNIRKANNLSDVLFEKADLYTVDAIHHSLIYSHFEPRHSLIFVYLLLRDLLPSTLRYPLQFSQQTNLVMTHHIYVRSIRIQPLVDIYIATKFTKDLICFARFGI